MVVETQTSGWRGAEEKLAACLYFAQYQILHQHTPLKIP